MAPPPGSPFGALYDTHHPTARGGCHRELPAPAGSPSASSPNAATPPAASVTRSVAPPCRLQVNGSARASNTPATMPSAQKWFAVATTAIVVSTGCNSTSQRHRLLDTRITTNAINSDQATWTEGIADSWSAMPLPNGP